MTHLEDNNMLHPQIFLNKVHSLGALKVLEGIIIVPIKSLHHVSFKVFDEINLALEVIGVVRNAMTFAHINGALST